MPKIETDNYPEDFGVDVDTGDETDEYEDIYNELTEAARQANHRMGSGGANFFVRGPTSFRFATSNDVPGGDALLPTLQNFMQNAASGGVPFGPRAQPNPSGTTGAQAGGTASDHTQTRSAPGIEVPNTNNLMSGENLLSAYVPLKSSCAFLNC